MQRNDILILKSDEVAALLKDRELDLIELVGSAYLAHARGHSSLPRSSFLLFPHRQRDRIIALPAYLGESFDVAGIKWIASFPENIDQGIERASAVLILNSTISGRPEVIMESSVISAKRTAASAALAARTLHKEPPSCIGFIGCGPINYQISKFLLAVWPDVQAFRVFDLSRARAREFSKDCSKLKSGLGIEIADSAEAVLRDCRLVSFATTAAKPHISDLSVCPPNATILHISLRDLSPETILASVNFVDDVDHVCQANTSVHLAEQMTGSREFISGTLAEVQAGNKIVKRDKNGTVVFSPFGLGVLDIAVAKLVASLAADLGVGTVLESFLPKASKK